MGKYEKIFKKATSWEEGEWQERQNLGLDREGMRIKKQFSEALEFLGQALIEIHKAKQACEDEYKMDSDERYAINEINVAYDQVKAAIKQVEEIF